MKTLNKKPLVSLLSLLVLSTTTNVFAQTTTQENVVNTTSVTATVINSNTVNPNVTTSIDPVTGATITSIRATIIKAPIQASTKFGTFNFPFAATSPWYLQPIEPTFGTFEIPKSSYFPAISSGAYSTAAFQSKATDKPMVVYGRTTKGVWNPDAESYQPSITIPHWPADTIGATGGDGHADIVDVEAGIIHSFWQLKKIGDKWTTELYAWMPINGTGWGDPAHYYQGGRAVGIPSMVGIIRKHEVDSGLPTYEHALAMSLTYSGLSKKPTYVYPATSADNDAQWSNYGQVPEGALLMLPKNYDSSKIASPALKKVVETLKKYGAYVVDRNDGTPFAIYVENGSTFRMSNLAWDNAVAAELQRIRGALRQVTGAKSWVDGNGRTAPSPLVAPKDLNVLSMRGPWAKNSGEVNGVFDTMSQSLVFPATSKVKTVMTNSNGRGLGGVSWAKRQPGATQKFTVKATGGATLSLTVYDGNKVFLKTANLGNNESARFVWPAGGWIVLTASSGLGQASSVRGELINVIDDKSAR